MGNVKLKPCPFCGSGNLTLRNDAWFEVAVRCNNCTADVAFDAAHLAENPDLATVDLWNRRVNND